LSPRRLSKRKNFRNVVRKSELTEKVSDRALRSANHKENPVDPMTFSVALDHWLSILLMPGMVNREYPL
jgi:hypothetical protein